MKKMPGINVTKFGWWSARIIIFSFCCWLAFPLLELDESLWMKFRIFIAIYWMSIVMNDMHNSVMPKPKTKKKRKDIELNKPLPRKDGIK